MPYLPDVDEISRVEAVSEVRSAIANEAETVFTWDYERTRPRLEKLSAKAADAQWKASDLDWSIEVDPFARGNVGQGGMQMQTLIPIEGTILERLDQKQLEELGYEAGVWLLSQFLHGEQGALLCTAQIVETVPWIDAKYYAATQVMDEARHVEVFGRYCQEKLGKIYPVNVHLRNLLSDIAHEPRWDLTYLGMQIMVEGLALAAFGFMQNLAAEPLLKELLRRVIADEARHVAFGVLSLEEVYRDLTAAEKRERQEFAYEAAIRMRDRFLLQEVWEHMGLPVRECVEMTLHSAPQQVFRQMLFSKIVPNLRKLGLLDGWLRERFGELGVLHLENLPDGETEFLSSETSATATATATA